ncbi:MAG: hypothetical protein ACP5U2_12225 [Bryobacteraceae bacterium]
MKTLWWLLPDEAMVLVIAAIGLALMLRLIRGRTAMGLLGTVVLLLLLGPFIDALLDLLPGWLLLLMLLLVAMALFRGILELFLGERAAAEAVGSLAADVIRFGFRLCCRLLVLPFRVVGWMLRRA